MLTIREMHNKGIIQLDTTIYIHIENEVLDTEYTVSGKRYDSSIREYEDCEMETMRLYKDKPDIVYFNLYV